MKVGKRKERAGQAGEMEVVGGGRAEIVTLGTAWHNTNRHQVPVSTTDCLSMHGCFPP